LEDASTIPIACKKITPACPELENIAATTNYDDLLEDSTVEKDRRILLLPLYSRG
jgi:hypothetical protein